ncbi:hypothetical protein [Chitinophaga caseinilytica]|uniref:RHS repeat-associated core domain-containing protein n=1 Tax=Chitinophaga caseinilytica TaxID=2267521 RepID=A0ABZ2Z965_9BACT
MNGINTLDPVALTGWMATGVKIQVIRHNYDQPVNSLPFVQTNLRRRIASSEYDVDGDGKIETATHFSYDVAGNVKSMWHYHLKMEEALAGQGLKQIDYQYDLVSGRVRALHYQNGQPDQFIYRYNYDAGNQLNSVSSSRDQLTWQNDASYQYYLHGAPARIELGTYKVQGTDYAYTLQGRLKGFNSGLLDPAVDMGEDGKSSSLHSTVARDVIAYTLGYHTNDYIAAGVVAAQAFNTAFNAPSVLSTGNGLYNGNVNSSTIAFSKLDNGLTKGYSYGYDQLNRLVEVRQHSGITGGWSNGSIIEDYKESISYDANGNILHLHRNSTTAGGRLLLMDKMAYNYKAGTNQLTFVTDEVASGNYSEDIDNQSSGNYAYDAAGRMIRDNAGGIGRINWNVFGKVSAVYGKNVVQYGYDANGSRIVKTTGDSSVFYIRDAIGNILSVYESTPAGFNWKEQHLYGNQRLGIWEQGKGMPARILSPQSALDTLSNTYSIGSRTYELSNHLGNVLATISDKKSGVSSGGALVDYYVAESLSQQDAYAFGMAQPGRDYSIDGKYRFGYNGQERSSEIDGNSFSAEYWQYDARIGRRWNPDPKAVEWESVYAANRNNPNVHTDPKGDNPVLGGILGALTEYMGIVGNKMLFEGMSFAEANSDLGWRDGLDIIIGGAMGAASGAIDGGLTRMAKWLSNPTHQKIFVKLLEVGVEALETSLKALYKDTEFDLKSILLASLTEVGLGHLMKSDAVQDAAEQAIKEVKPAIVQAERKIKDLSKRAKPQPKLIKKAKYEKKIAIEKGVMFTTMHVGLNGTGEGAAKVVANAVQDGVDPKIKKDKKEEVEKPKEN